jgi:hypothetical protein
VLKISCAAVVAVLALGGAAKASAAGCDIDAATKVQTNLLQMASWYETEGVVKFTWKDNVGTLPRDQQLGLIKTFADSDACMQGMKAREIQFFLNGKMMGVASPASGVRLLN